VQDGGGVGEPAGRWDKLLHGEVGDAGGEAVFSPGVDVEEVNW